MTKKKYQLAHRYQRLVNERYPQHTYTRDTLLQNLSKCHNQLFPEGSPTETVQTYALKKVKKLPVYKTMRPTKEMCSFKNLNARVDTKKFLSWKTWANNTSQYPDIQKYIEKRLEYIIGTYFKYAGEYAVEKLVKSYCEPLSMLERHLTKAEFPKSNTLSVQVFLKQYEDALERVKKVMKSEVKRQTRHYITFLAEVSIISKQAGDKYGKE